MIKGKLVVVSNLTTFKTIQQSSDPIPDSAIVFIKNEGQIWTKGSYFGVQKTYDVVSKTDAGLAPKGGDSASSLIANVDDEWVLTVTNGANPSWRKLPANAFKNQTYTFYNLAFKNSSGTTVDTYKPSTSPSKSVKAGTNVKISASSNTITISATDTTYNVFTGASDSVDGSLGLVPKPTKGNQSKFLKADGSWATPTDTTYPIVSSTKDGLVPKFDANDGTIDQLDKDWVLTNNNGSIGWYKLPANAFNNSTYSLVNNSSNGLVPILPTTNSTTISTQADEWVLTTTKGGEPSWRKLPTTAFYSLPTAKTNALGGIKVGSVSTSAFADLTGKYYTVNVDKNGVAYVNVPWTDTPYTLPTASSTLGGVKTTSTVSSTTGLTACPIIDGVVYYKNSDSNTWRGIYVGGTSKMGTANNTKALNFAAGNNVTISYAAPGTASGQSGNASYGTLTINATNTWTAWKGATSSANGTAGYMPAPTSALRNQFLRGDGTWQSLNNYSLPTASSSTLGGVKTGAAITDTTGYTPVHIKDGVIYYKGSSTGYLPLSGGTMLGDIIFTAEDSSTPSRGIHFKSPNNKYLYAKNDELYFGVDNSTTGKIWHSGNDGSGSGLDADLLDGKHLYEIIRYEGYSNKNANEADTPQTITYWAENGGYGYTYGTALNIQGAGSWNNRIAFRTDGKIDYYQGINTGDMSYIGQLAFTSSNVASATKLQTARTIWGQSFDGSSDITGDLTISNNKFIYTKHSDGTSLNTVYTSTDNVTVFGYGAATKSIPSCLDGFAVYLRYGTGHNIGFTLNSTGNVGIGTTSPLQKMAIQDGGIDLYNTQGNYEGAISFNRKSALGGLYNSSHHGHQIHSYKGDLHFYVEKTDGSAYTAMALQGSTGNVGINTDSPSYKLHVNGSLYATSGNVVLNMEGEDFNPNNWDGTYIGMSTQTSIEGSWRHVISMNWSQGGWIAGNATWCSLLSLPTLDRKGIYYRSATGEKTWGPWVKLLDSTDSVGGGSSFNGTWAGTLRIDGSNSRGNYPSVKWHIPNTNWAQILMNDAGELEFRGGGGLDAGYSNVRMGILVCTSLQINGSTLTFVT